MTALHTCLCTFKQMQNIERQKSYSNTETSQKKKNSFFVPSTSIVVVFLSLVFGSMRSQLTFNYKAIDQSQNNILDAEIRATMLQLPRNALVLLRGDHITNVMRYLQTCDNGKQEKKKKTINYRKQCFSHF